MNVLNNVHEKYSRANVKCNHISKLSMEIPTTTITIYMYKLLSWFIVF